MAGFASGSRVRLVQSAETVRGTTNGSPTWKVLRTITRDVDLSKTMLTSAEVRSDRQVKDVRHGFNSVGGSFGFELSVGGYDDSLAALLGGAWGVVSITGTPNLQATASTSTFTRAAGSFVTDSYFPGDVIVTSGFTSPSNNGIFTVISVTATTLVVNGTLVDEASTTGRTIVQPGQRLTVGTTLSTFSMERQFLDINQYQVMKGCNPDTMALSIKPAQIVGGTMNIIGMSATAWSGSAAAASPTAATTNAPLSSFEGVLVEGGTAIAIVTGLDLNVANGRGTMPVVGSKFTPDVFDGTCKVTGTLTALFKDAVLLNKFMNETLSSLFINLDDINGTDFMSFVMPAIKYTGGKITPPAEGAVPISLPFQALVDTSTGNSLRIQRSNP